MGGLDQRGEVGALVVAAEQDDRTRLGKRRDRLERRVDVGRLGIVVAGGAADGAARLDAVLKRRERAQTACDRLVAGAQRYRGCRGGKRVAHVVGALDLQIRRRDKAMLRPFERDRQHAVRIGEGGVVGAACGAHVAGVACFGADGNAGEPAFGGIQGLERADLGAHLVVGGVEHRRGARGLGQVGQDLELGIAVRFERSVPFEMIGRDVEQHRRIGGEARRGLQLVGRRLRHEHAVGALRHRGKAGVADVADGDGVHPRLAQQVRRERGDRGLAVGARDGDPARRRGAFAPGKLDFSDDLRGKLRAASVQLGRRRDARAGHAQVEPPAGNLPGQRIDRIVAERDDGALLGEAPSGLLGSLRAGSRRNVEPRHAIAQEGQAVVDHRRAAFAQAQDEHVAEPIRPAANQGLLLRRAHASSPPSWIRQSR